MDIKKKIHTKSDRRGRKAIRLGSVSLGWDLEGKGDCTGRYLPWGVSSDSPRSDAPVLGSYMGETSPCGCLEDDWD